MRIGLDLDGTLLDSRLRHIAALRKAAESLAVPLAEDDAQRYLRLKCDGANGLEALKELRIPEAESINKRWMEIIESEDMIALDHLYPDTLDALGRRQSRPKEFILVTGRQNPSAARRQISKLGLEPYFREVIVVDPQRGAASKASVTRTHDLSEVVGDTEIDLQWAQDLGVNFYASSFGFRSQNYWDRRKVVSYASLSSVFDAIASAPSKREPRLS
jgi:phosphoglycolate phosphatase-like HAD superfamily hydrolase